MDAGCALHLLLYTYVGQTVVNGVATRAVVYQHFAALSTGVSPTIYRIILTGTQLKTGAAMEGYNCTIS